jgi:uncharacterized membrane protein
VADTEAPLPDHTEETIRSIAELRAEHHENATALERALDHITSMLSRPWFIGVISVVVIGWIGLNLGRSRSAFHPSIRLPFSWLGGAVPPVSLTWSA